MSCRIIERPRPEARGQSSSLVEARRLVESVLESLWAAGAALNLERAIDEALSTGALAAGTPADITVNARLGDGA